MTRTDKIMCSAIMFVIMTGWTVSEVITNHRWPVFNMAVGVVALIWGVVAWIRPDGEQP